MELYLIKSVACLAIFFAFYKLVLERQNMHQLKRFYLLGSTLASFGIPLITFTQYIEVAPMTTNFIFSDSLVDMPIETPPIDYLAISLWSVYFLGVLFFTIRFSLNLTKMVRKIRRNHRLKFANIFHVLLHTPTTPHTFFSYVFLNKNKFESNEIPPEVLLHEETHAKQLHSLDVLCMELLQIMFWFNPLIYFIKHSMKLNHEFLADQAVLKKGVATAAYQNILLAFSSSASSPTLANSINYSFIKKRFTVMKTQTSKRGIWLRSLLLLPLLSCLIYGFSTKEIIETPAESLLSEIPMVLDTSEEMNADIPVLRLSGRPIEYSLNNSRTTLEALAEDFKAVTKGELSDLRINAEGPVAMSLIQDIMERLKGNLEQVLLSQGAHIEDDTVSLISDPIEVPQKTKLKESPQEKILRLLVEQSELYLNGRKTSLKNFAKDVDAFTKGWEETDYTNANTQVRISNTPKEFLDKVDEAFRKTHFSKANGGIGIIPPPPPPPPAPPTPTGYVYIDGEAHYYSHKDGKTTYFNKFGEKIDPKGKKITTYKPDEKAAKGYINGRVVKDLSPNGPGVLPPPPPPPTDASLEMERNYKEALEVYKQNKAARAKHAKLTYREQQAQAKGYQKRLEQQTPALKGHVSVKPPPPPPPPAPEEPIDHIVTMAKKGATFYYEGKKINSDKAIELLKKNKRLNIQTTGYNGQNPEVRLSKKPIEFNTNKGGAVVPGTDVKNKNSYFQKYNKAAIAQGRSTPRIAKNAIFYLNDVKITEAKGMATIKNDPNARVQTINEKDEQQVVLISSKPIIGYAAALPKANPKNIVDQIKVMNRHNADFYINNEEISFRKALNYVKENRTAEMTTSMNPPVVVIRAE